MVTQLAITLLLVVPRHPYKAPAKAHAFHPAQVLPMWVSLDVSVVAHLPAWGVE